MLSTQTLTQIIAQRYSVRIFKEIQIPGVVLSELHEKLNSIHTGPLGSPLRLGLIAAGSDDTSILRGLGTYGAIKHPAGFIIGAVQEGEYALEDYGYAMEDAVLHATFLGLGTCWLGGFFMQSGFAAHIGKQADELIPAITAMGFSYEDGRIRDPSRLRVGAEQRMLWEDLFFDRQFGNPLKPETAGIYHSALENIRLAPSAKNKQPWRVVRDGTCWHFYCRRTPGYGKGTLVFALLRAADLQRVDIGIAMCHFILTLRAQGINGTWCKQDPGFSILDKNTFYVATWKEDWGSNDLHGASG